MPRNYGKGGKNRRKGKKMRGGGGKSKLDKAEGEDQCYARVDKILGGCRCRLILHPTNKIVVGHIRGNMQKRVWIATDDIVKVCLRGFQDDKCDIVLKYNSSEVSKLTRLGEITDTFTQNRRSGGVQTISDDGFIYGEPGPDDDVIVDSIDGSDSVIGEDFDIDEI